MLAYIRLNQLWLRVYQFKNSRGKLELEDRLPFSYVRIASGERR